MNPSEKSPKEERVVLLEQAKRHFSSMRINAESCFDLEDMGAALASLATGLEHLTEFMLIDEHKKRSK